MWSSPSTPSKSYSKLGGSGQLPLFHMKQSHSFESLHRFNRSRVTWRFLLTVSAFASVLVLVNVMLWRLLSWHDERDADLSFAARERALRGGTGSETGLVMSDEEALFAMYPPTAERVPQSHTGDPTACERRYTLLLVSDMDELTQHPNGTWRSSLRRGSLCWRGPDAPRAAAFSVSWVDEVPLTSALNAGGRGMELSELVWFGGRLLTCDDRTGVVYEVSGGRTRPAYILADGDGHADHGFKCEWATVRHGLLHVGGLGRAWTDDSGRAHEHISMWTKLIEPGGTVRHLNWSAPFSAMRSAAGCGGAGYLSHEAALWDDATDRWLFLPRRASPEAWGRDADEERGANLMLWSEGSWAEWERPHASSAAAGGSGGSSSSSHSQHRAAHAPRVSVGRVEGPLVPRRGFSSAKLLPGGGGMLVALRTEEYRGKMATYLTVLSTNGSVLMEDTHIADVKYEGLEVAV